MSNPTISLAAFEAALKGVSSVGVWPCSGYAISVDVSVAMYWARESLLHSKKPCIRICDADAVAIGVSPDAPGAMEVVP